MSEPLTELHVGQRLLFKFNPDYASSRGDAEIVAEVFQSCRFYLCSDNPALSGYDDKDVQCKTGYAYNWVLDYKEDIALRDFNSTFTLLSVIQEKSLGELE